MGEIKHYELLRQRDDVVDAYARIIETNKELVNKSANLEDTIHRRNLAIAILLFLLMFIGIVVML